MNLFQNNEKCHYFLIGFRTLNIGQTIGYLIPFSFDLIPGKIVDLKIGNEIPFPADRLCGFLSD